MKHLDKLVIAPYYEDVAAHDFCQELAQTMSDDDYVLIVDDGSITTPFNSELLDKNNINGSVLKLTRNVGHQLALNTGIYYATKHFNFNALITMDSDGEDVPADIDKLVNALKQSDDDVVVASRRSRTESIRFKLFYLFYKLFFRCLVGRTIKFGNFMAMTNKAAQRLSNSSETRLHLAAAVLNSKLRIRQLDLDRGARYAGTSKMNLISLTLHGLRSIMVFSDQVLVRLTLFSIAFALVVISAMFVMTAMKVSGAAIPGWYSTGGGILLVLLLQAGFMALMMLLLSGRINNQPIPTMDFESLICEVIPSNKTENASGTYSIGAAHS